MINSAFAALHFSGVCINIEGGANVYNEEATKNACAAYQTRNTGEKQWDTCPDCEMTTIGGVELCHSGEQHIGGDELYYYCQQAGAADSMAD
ncbi:hypothetical protein EJ04DRAFT_562675 [Polyplosphaeria fusca]|uniref:Uncharacterized protein n=1 Tax=Polyplosphaeria fusca TaxID=682080 RepID=A0A9P4R3C2_9PLEO|nr:hypothetical protein EJ04DRAFT_562675 [Polyplosphaeria fusca]